MKHSIKIWEAEGFLKKKKILSKSNRNILKHLLQIQEDTSAGHPFDVHKPARP